MDTVVRGLVLSVSLPLLGKLLLILKQVDLRVVERHGARGSVCRHLVGHLIIEYGLHVFSQGIVGLIFLVRLLIDQFTPLRGAIDETDLADLTLTRDLVGLVEVGLLR